MIELGFSLGRSLAEVEKLPERDLQLYMAYASKRPLPWRRMEAYLAQIASVVAQVNGNKMGLDDFLMDKKEVQIMSEYDAAIAMGFNPPKPE